eukprot:GEMP01112150.1.p1 GENE.GEMP01112150.1~~GEMP01112150.1.p1  ORF type:complete len:115 (-),score=2.80 GEMP01112150.1:48-392(-)
MNSTYLKQTQRAMAMGTDIFRFFPEQEAGKNVLKRFFALTKTKHLNYFRFYNEEKTKKRNISKNNKNNACEHGQVRHLGGVAFMLKKQSVNTEGRIHARRKYDLPVLTTLVLAK